jgi:hypothetical protein
MEELVKFYIVFHQAYYLFLLGLSLKALGCLMGHLRQSSVEHHWQQVTVRNLKSMLLLKEQS